jgi:hypothetical protein
MVYKYLSRSYGGVWLRPCMVSGVWLIPCGASVHSGTISVSSSRVLRDPECVKHTVLTGKGILIVFRDPDCVSGLGFRDPEGKREGTGKGKGNIRKNNRVKPKNKARPRRFCGSGGKAIGSVSKNRWNSGF